LRQYHGRYDPGIEADLIASESCSLFLNITKSKTHAYNARVMDMAIPTDEKNWSLTETPVPELAQFEKKPLAQAMQAGPDGTMQPMTTPEGAPIQNQDMSEGIRKEAKSRAEKMEDEVNDQLVEAKYNAAQRQAIEQMGKLGTGIVMGPVIIDEWKVAWQPGPGGQWVRKLVPNTDKRPGVEWIDCWHFYPDMSANDPKGWAHATVQYIVNDAEFRKFSKRFNFMPKACETVSNGGCKFNVRTMRWMQELKSLSETQNIVDNRHRLLRFYGEITTEDLVACGRDPHEMGLEEGESLRGTVWHCDGVVLKVDINPLDSGAMPFSVAYCDKDEASPFGIGIPRIMRGEQESVNAAWRMKHDNAALSVCPQTVIKAAAVTPADGDYHMKPKKVWYVADEVQNVANVFAQFSIDSHQDELDNILQLAIRFADDVTQLPLIMQGDQAPHITQTAQGMSLLYNASTVVLRRTVKFYDDFHTEPMISRFYDWNMQFNPKEEIKGDMRCVARGSASLLEKEQQGIAYNEAMALAATPTWQPYFDMKKLLKKALDIKKIGDVMLSDSEIEKNLKEQQEQAAAAAAAAAPKAAPGKDPALQSQEMALRQAEIDARNRATDSNERIAIAKIASSEKISYGDAAARLAGIKIGKSADIEMFNAELGVKQQVGTGI
jgi:hypothetical protein